MKNKSSFNSNNRHSFQQDNYFSDYMQMLKRRKWVIISLFILIVGSVAIASLITPPKFEAKAQILLGGQPTPMNPLGESQQRLPEINLYHHTQVNLLNSRAIARKVIGGLELQKDYPDEPKASVLSSLLGTFSLKKANHQEKNRIPAQNSHEEHFTFEEKNKLSESEQSKRDDANALKSSTKSNEHFVAEKEIALSESEQSIQDDTNASINSKIINLLKDGKHQDNHQKQEQDTPIQQVAAKKEALPSDIGQLKKGGASASINSDELNQKFTAQEETPLSEAKHSKKEGANVSNVSINPKVVNWYLGNLRIDPVRNSSLVNVSFTGSNPKLTAEIVNKHAEAAIDITIEQHRENARNALNWLRSQIAEQKSEVETYQRAIYEFKKQHNTLSLDDSQIISSQEMQELNSALTRAKSDRIAKQATYLQMQEVLNNDQNVMQLSEFAKDPVIQNLRNQLVDLMSEKIELGTMYGPKHPKIIKLDSGINQIKLAIDGEKNRQIKSIKSDLDRAVAIENSINNSLKSQKNIAMSLGERAIEYEVLKQQAESAQDIYDFLLKQSEELGLSSAISSSNMQIVDRAVMPVVPVSPNLKMNLLLAVFLSLFAGAGIVFLLEFMDNTIKTPLDVSVKLGLPVLGMIPFHKSIGKPNSKNQITSDLNKKDRKKLPPTTYHISNRLPDELRSPVDGLFGRVLMVESVTMKEGKTTVISKIASNLTEAGLRVLLVDCDFQRPSLEKVFGVTRNGGLGKSIDQITSYNISNGSLNDYSVGDLFFIISLKKKSGRLIVENEDQALTAHFQNGVLVHIQNENCPENNRIGSMLLNGGFITTDQLDDAMSRHQRTGQPLGYILVNAGYIGREKLRGPLRLQIEEHLQKMFSWKKGSFSFKPGITSIYENEKIFFDEDYSPMINNLDRIEKSIFIEKQLFDHITSLKKENLYLLPAGTSYKLIGSLNQILMKKIFEQLKQRFDVLLVDTPPLDAASGVESLFPLADGIVLVVKAGHLSVRVLNGAINHLPQDKIIGTILNQVKMAQSPYYY